MAFTKQRFFPLRFRLAALVLLPVCSLPGKSIRVPAHVFPDPKSDIITYVEVDSTAPSMHPQVLDASLGEPWYWSTYRGEFVGYVKKREVISRNQLKEGTLVRTNPTHRSWVLTRYERGDLVNVRSRLSVGRVSFDKEIPIYFQMPDPAATHQHTEPGGPAKREQTPSLPEPEVAAPTEASMAESEPAPSTPTSVDAPVTPEEAIPAETPRIEFIPERADPTESIASQAELIDPLLEEQPRMPPQDLANLAPPPADLHQEFEGFLRIVDAEDPRVDSFQYQLETRSGQRIVYVQVDQLRRGSYQNFVDQWINIRGTLDEIGEDFTLFIDARSIWIAPAP